MSQRPLEANIPYSAPPSVLPGEASGAHIDSGSYSQLLSLPEPIILSLGAVNPTSNHLNFFNITDVNISSIFFQ